MNSHMRMSLEEYSENLKLIEAIRVNSAFGGSKVEEVQALCDLAKRCLVNSQILMLDRVFPSISIHVAKCPGCSQNIIAMKSGEGVAWYCDSCGTSSNRNHRMPTDLSDPLSKETQASTVEDILLHLQRKKKATR